MGGLGDFIISAAAADDPDIAWGKYLAGQDLPDIAGQQQRQLTEVQRATADAQRRVREAVGMPAEASTRAGRLVEGGTRFLGNPITWLGGPEGFGAKALTGFLSGVGSEAAGELAAGTKWETPMRLAGSIAGPMAPGVGARGFNSLYDALPRGAGAFGGKLIQPAEAGLVREWLPVEPGRFRGTVRLDPPAISGELLDESGAPIGSVDREIDPASKTAYHRDLQLSPASQGAGFSRDMMRSSINFYRQQGLNTVDAVADDIGSYVWAKYGLVPDQVSWDELRRSLARRIGSPDVQLPPDVRQDVQRLLLDPDPRAIWKLSDLRAPALTASGEPVLTSLGRPMTLGQQLLLGQRWHGTLNMRDEATMRRFDKYMETR